MSLSVIIISVSTTASIIGIINTAFGQSNSSSIEEQLKTANQQLNTHFEDVLRQRLGADYATDIQIVYESPTMVVVTGDVIAAGGGPLLNFDHVFWQGIEIFKKDYGFTLDKFAVNGLGSEVNPERFYAILVK